MVLMKASDKPGASGGPLGSSRVIKDALALFNTAVDGGPGNGSTEVLHGPGLFLEMPMNQPEIQQAMITVTDDDIAWPVLSKACRKLGWTMVDLETGRAFL
jgi:hypothetical protein